MGGFPPPLHRINPWMASITVSVTSLVVALGSRHRPSRGPRGLHGSRTVPLFRLLRGAARALAAHRRGVPDAALLAELQRLSDEGRLAGFLHAVAAIDPRLRAVRSWHDLRRDSQASARLAHVSGGALESATRFDVFFSKSCCGVDQRRVAE